MNRLLEKNPPSRSNDWRPVSRKYEPKYKQLLKVWEEEPKSLTIVNGNGVRFEEDYFVGGGSYGTEVYICLGADGIERAIKRLPKRLDKQLLKNERNILTSPNAVDSPRIVNYWFYDCTSSLDFCYLILNLYEQNLEEYIRGIRKNGGAIAASRAREMIRQVLEGLQALHATEPRILHRDLKPTNILVDVKGNLALSDFGIGRFFEEGATTHHTVHQSGTKGWVAYECIDWDGLYTNELKDPDLPGSRVQLRCKEQSDIQVAGMVGFFILTKGKHPFGAPIHRLKNLHDDNPECLAELSDPVVKDLLSQMLAMDLDKRPLVEQALKHPYFLTVEEQMNFIEAVGNESEIRSIREDPSCPVSNELDNRDQLTLRSPLLPANWKVEFGRGDLDKLCARGRAPSTYDGVRYTHCLRLIRNVRQHSDGKLDLLNDKRGATSFGEYFLLRLFPNLPLVLHQIIKKHPTWTTRDALKDFFPVINR